MRELTPEKKKKKRKINWNLIKRHNNLRLDVISTIPSHRGQFRGYEVYTQIYVFFFTSSFPVLNPFTFLYYQRFFFFLLLLVEKHETHFGTRGFFHRLNVRHTPAFLSLVLSSASKLVFRCEGGFAAGYHLREHVIRDTFRRVFHLSMATVKWRTGGHRGEISVAEHKTQRRVASARARRTCPTAPAHGRDASQCQRRASEATRRGGSPRQCRSRSIDKMAALIRHGSMLQCLRGSMLIPNARTPLASFERTLKIKTRRTRVLVRKFEWDGKSLAARGFLRPTKSYEPAKDVPERFDEICKSEGLPVDESTKLDDPVKRFGIFVACEKAFNYPLPNSIIHTIETIGDLKNFYVTPINSTVPFEAMRKTDLPPNLHILYNYHRFHPDDDTKFGGKTAFPYSSTLVTGLKYKKKYQSLILRQGFP